LALLSLIGFIAAVAAITADKFNSEIGVLATGQPRMIFGLKKVKKGTSGGISVLGLVAGLFAALVVSLLFILVIGRFGIKADSAAAAKVVIAVTIAGFIGSLVDSMLGYYEERGIGNKFTSNFACGIIAALVAVLIFMLV